MHESFGGGGAAVAGTVTGVTIESLLCLVSVGRGERTTCTCGRGCYTCLIGIVVDAGAGVDIASIACFVIIVDAAVDVVVAVATIVVTGFILCLAQ